MTRIDLNCDMGESADPAVWSLEARAMPYLSSVNIACGWHAGSPHIMRLTVQAAKPHGLAIGAHPGYRDPVGHGRRHVGLSVAEVEHLIAYQIGALAGIAALESSRLSHVKPHGALYHHAAHDPACATAIVRAIVSVDRALAVYGLAGSRLIEIARTTGLTAVEEAFADRAYQPDGTLVPRGQAGAVLTDPQRVMDQVLRVVRDGCVRSIDGQSVPLQAGTLCLHGDTPGALELAMVIRRTLEEAGVQIARPGRN